MWLPNRIRYLPTPGLIYVVALKLVWTAKGVQTSQLSIFGSWDSIFWPKSQYLNTSTPNLDISMDHGPSSGMCWRGLPDTVWLWSHHRSMVLTPSTIYKTSDSWGGGQSYAMLLMLFFEVILCHLWLRSVLSCHMLSSPMTDGLFPRNSKAAVLWK